MRIRLAVPTDADAIRTIYNAEIVGTEHTTFDLVPRTPAEQAAWMVRHQGAHPAVVAVAEPAGAPAGRGGDPPAPSARSRRRGAAPIVDTGGVVLGFGALTPYRSRPAYATSVENSVYVDRAHRGEGVGRAVLEELIRLASDHGFHTVIARVVGDNEASVGLHRSCGFEVVGVEREIGRRHGRWLDVVELQRML